MDVELSPFSVPLADPLTTAAGTIEEREGVLVRISDGTTVGVGEATPLPGWTEHYDRCRRALTAATELLTSAGPGAAIDRLESTDRPDDRTSPSDDATGSATAAGGPSSGGSMDATAATGTRLRATPAARHGLSLALADLRARRGSVPLYRHLGARQRVDRIPVNATVGDVGPDETAAAVEAAVDAGTTCVKLKVGARDPAADADRVLAARAAAEPDTELRVDANGAWDRSTATAALEWLAAARVSYVEQPLAPTDLEGHATLRGGPVGVALDESLHSYGLDAVLGAGAADVLVCKPMVLGGVDRARDLAARARERGLDAVVTTTIDAVVARTGAVHVAASLGLDRHCGLATGGLLEADLAPDPAPVADGTVEVPSGPGTGVSMPDGYRRGDR